MNTSKSLYDLLCDVMDWGSSNTQKGISPEKAKQAIVEAVEGLMGEDDERDTVAHSPCNTACHAISTNLTKQEIRQAIKEWQDYGG